MKKIFCCPALELFCCLPLWKTVLFVSSRAFSLSTLTFLFPTPVENSEATWKKATKCNKLILVLIFLTEHKDCEVCGKSFWGNNAKQNFTNHLKLHKKEETIQIKPIPITSYNCDYCKKTYKTKSLLNRHKRQNCKEHLQ